MGALLRWFLLLLPILEIATFIEVGDLIGTGPTVALVVASALLGVALLRRQGGRQGVSALKRAQAAADRGETPVGAMFSGFCVAVGAILLIIPGFLTDLVALPLLVPPLRNGLGRWLFERMRRSGGLHVWTNGRGMGGSGYGGPGYGGSRRPPGGAGVIDADYREVDPQEAGQPDAGPAGTVPPLEESRWRPGDPSERR